MPAATATASAMIVTPPMSHRTPPGEMGPQFPTLFWQAFEAMISQIVFCNAHATAAAVVPNHSLRDET
jgi:hypothetical protein